MTDFTITLTDTEKKSLEFVCVDVHDWIENAAQARAKIAKREIIDILIKHCNENEIAMAVGEAAQVQQAYDLNLITTAAARSSRPPTV